MWQNFFLIFFLCVMHQFGMPTLKKTHRKKCYTRGQVSVNKRISVLSNYFDVSFEIYYVRLKYTDSIGQVVKLLILRPASICCTFNSGHVGSRAPNVNQMGCPFYFHTSRVRLKHKYLFRSWKKERNYYFAFNKRSHALYNTTKWQSKRKYDWNFWMCNSVWRF